MRRILAVVSGRADASPMAPVIAALDERGCKVRTLDVGGMAFHDVVHHADDWINRDRPDAFLVLGDRYEIDLATVVATVAGVPIAHIHGGELTPDHRDQKHRDAITMRADLHFVATAKAGARVLAKFGHTNVHLVGAPGLDNLVHLPERKPEPYFVATYHPPTGNGVGAINELIEALSRFPDHRVIWTGANADPGGHAIDATVGYWAGAELCADLSLKDYIALARNAAAIVGNSSAGIIEAPTLRVPSVNIGLRQEGRPKGPSVFDRAEEVEAIVDGIKDALAYDAEYRRDGSKDNRFYTNPYGGPGASAKIAEILSEWSL